MPWRRIPEVAEVQCLQCEIPPRYQFLACSCESALECFLMCVLHARLSPYESILTSTFRFKSTTVVLHAYNIYLIYRILTSSQHHAPWTFDTMVCGRYGTRQNPKQLSNRKWKGGHVATSFINEMVALCFLLPLQCMQLAHGRDEHQYKEISILVHNQKSLQGSGWLLFLICRDKQDLTL